MQLHTKSGDLVKMPYFLAVDSRDWTDFIRYQNGIELSVTQMKGSKLYSIDQRNLHEGDEVKNGMEISADFFNSHLNAAILQFTNP